MRFRLAIILLSVAFIYPEIIHAQVPVGRWEIVHTSGDNATQTALYPGGFSTFLLSGGTGYTYGTTANSICVIDQDSTNVVPTWIGLGGEVFQITITVNNEGAGPNFAFVYTGTYAETPVPGDTTYTIPTISGIYYYTGDASACSDATMTNPGNFVATFVPTISSGSASGSLDGFTTGGGTPFDSSVDATVTFSAPSPGQIAGTVSLASNPSFNLNACFATTSGVVNPLTIDSNQSFQSGIFEQIYAQGFDPQGNPTTLVLDGYSANLYTTDDNTDASANQITSNEWAAGAAIGEDDPDAGTVGVDNDGTNNAIVLFYGVIGGSCDGAGGADSPFHFLSGKPVAHGHKRHHRGRKKFVPAPVRFFDKDPFGRKG
jgi:hypothetical protein